MKPRLKVLKGPRGENVGPSVTEAERHHCRARSERVERAAGEAPGFSHSLLSEPQRQKDTLFTLGNLGEQSVAAKPLLKEALG